MNQKQSDLFSVALGNFSTVLKSAKGSLKTLGILENESLHKIQDKIVEMRKNPTVQLAEQAAKEITTQVGTSLRREVVKRVGGSLGIVEKSEMDALQQELHRLKQKKSPAKTRKAPSSKKKSHSEA